MNLCQKCYNEIEDSATIEVVFVGEAAQQLKRLERDTGQDVRTLVGGALSLAATLEDFADREGNITLNVNGNHVKVQLPKGSKKKPEVPPTP